MKNRTKKQIDCVEKLKILGDDTRLSVLQLLMNSPRYVGEMNAILGLEQSLLSHHLQVLRRAKLVVQERDGKAVLYRLAPEVELTASKALNLGCCVLYFQENL
ncbi:MULTISPECIES: ArsR/SmtB family transcription factor [Nostocales]|uniref:ArsR family transcriptional regulator n=3 Tax=Nostocales TaxID=1161 RepID=A0A0C1RJB4_9CYAN|nr:metalloregulator ArsR/SmtB family transcription factor [Tolypothrix bouteillei]KAF3890589.1 winged helix-turn-helix transcriptional regulator [Tolypothrix bouteillei VB521301]